MAETPDGADPRIKQAQDLCQAVLAFIRTEIGESRDLSIARTHIETASLWIAKHLNK